MSDVFEPLDDTGSQHPEEEDDKSNFFAATTAEEVLNLLVTEKNRAILLAFCLPASVSPNCGWVVDHLESLAERTANELLCVYIDCSRFDKPTAVLPSVASVPTFQVQFRDVVSHAFAGSSSAKLDVLVKAALGVREDCLSSEKAEIEAAEREAAEAAADVGKAEEAEEEEEEEED